MISEGLLRALCPRPASGAAAQKAWDGYVAALSSEEAAKLFERFELTTKLRVAHALANWAHETGGLSIVWESGAYSAQRIMQIFGVGKHSARVTWPEAKRLAYNGPALFDRVYGVGNAKKSVELGNDRPGDGWRYRGVGIVQITGKRDHHRYAAQIGCPVEDLQKPLPSIHAALLEWQAKGCNTWADQDDYVKVRRLINGGRNGLADVRQYLARVKILLDQEWPKEKIAPVDNIVRLGSEGPLVYWIQQQLMVHGYYVGALDSYFGKETEKQLTAWQKQHGFAPTGEFDPDDKEQQRELALSPIEAVDNAPRRDVTAKDLQDRGSETVAQTSWWKSLLTWVFGVNAAAAADQATGLGAVDAVVKQGEEVTGLMTRTTNLLKFMPDTKVLIFVGVGVVCFALYKAWDNAEKRRVRDAQSGAHMGR